MAIALLISALAVVLTVEGPKQTDRDITTKQTGIVAKKVTGANTDASATAAPKAHKPKASRRKAKRNNVTSDRRKPVYRVSKPRPQYKPPEVRTVPPVRQVVATQPTPTPVTPTVAPVLAEEPATDHVTRAPEPKKRPVASINRPQPVATVTPEPTPVPTPEPTPEPTPAQPVDPPPPAEPPAPPQDPVVPPTEPEVEDVPETEETGDEPLPPDQEVVDETTGPAPPVGPDVIIIEDPE